MWEKFERYFRKRYSRHHFYTEKNRNMSKVSGRSSYVNDWIKKLKYRGIDTYMFNDLPEELKNLSAHRRAIAEELVERIGKKAIGRSIWKVK